MTEHSDHIDMLRQRIQTSKETRELGEKLTEKHNELRKKWKKPKLIGDSDSP